jgi:hypothetical protein
MKPDNFETDLERQTLRSIPAEWRREILEKARAASAPRASTDPERAAPSLSTADALPWWRAWLWPCPQAWAGLAALWLLLLGLNLTAPQSRDQFAAQSSPSTEQLSNIADQRREFARLLDLNLSETPMIPPSIPKPPGPRSELPVDAGVAVPSV